MRVLIRTSTSVLMVLFLTVGLSYGQYGQGVAGQNLYKGAEYAAQGKFREAKEKFEEALKADPFYEPAKRVSEVIEDVTRKKIESKTAIHFFKGLFYALGGFWDEAISEYTKAIESNQWYAYSYVTRGGAYLNKGQYDKAFSDLNKAIELNSKFAHAYRVRGIAWRKKGDFHRAISDFTKAIELDPSNAEAYLSRGVAYTKIGLYDEAIFDCDKAIEINPEDALVFVNRGYAYYRKGEYNKAWEDVYMAQSLGIQVDDSFIKGLREASGRKK